MKLNSFISGFLIGSLLLLGLWHWEQRSRNILENWPDSQSKRVISSLIPWLTDAKVRDLGPFLAIVPSPSVRTQEALLRPVANLHPWVYVRQQHIIIHDSRNRAISIDLDGNSGFRSYSYYDNVASGSRFVDRKMNGELERVHSR